MKEDKPYGEFTIEKLKELVEEIFKERPNKKQWYDRISTQQRESVDKIFKAEVEKQLEESGEKPWWDNPNSDTAKEWTKVKKMNKKTKKYKKYS